MRLFVAFDVGPAVAEYLRVVQKALPPGLVLAKSFHITLKFLGDVSEKVVPKIMECLKQVKFSAFDVSLSGVGVFPSESYARVVWVGLEPRDKVCALQHAVDRVLSGLFGSEERFEPHITLARVKAVKDRNEFVRRVRDVRIKPRSFRVREVKLVKSTLSPKGSAYEDIFVVQGQE